MVYKVPPGDIFANNYGREHMKSSNQVRSDIQLPLSYQTDGKPFSSVNWLWASIPVFCVNVASPLLLDLFSGLPSIISSP